MTLSDDAGNDETPTHKRQRDSLPNPFDTSDSALSFSGKRLKITVKPTAPTYPRVNVTKDILPLENINPSDPNQPRSPFCHPLRPSLERLVTEVVEEITQAFQQQEKPGHNDAELQGVITKLQKYAIPSTNYEAPRPVAFLGKAGVGKSLTLSCVIDQPGISLDSKDPVRGTNLTHEYSAFESVEDDDQDDPEEAATPTYRAEAVYFSHDQIKVKVDRICEEAFSFLDSCDDDLEEQQVDFGDDDFDGDDSKPAPSRLSTHESGKKYNSAIEYLVIMLCDQVGFADKNEIDGYFRAKHTLRKTSSEGDMDVLAQTSDHLMTLIGELLETRIESQEANSLYELQQAYKAMSKPECTLKPHPWPAMEKLSVSVDHALLNAGAVLGDTPGLSDSDQNVLDGMTSYVNHAGALVLCTTFARSNADSVLDIALELSVNLNMQRKTFLVLTMIDESKPERTPEEMSRLQHSPEDAQAIESAEQRTATARLHQQTLIDDKQQLANEKAACRTRLDEITANLARDPTLLNQFVSSNTRIKELENEIDLVQDKIERMPACIAKLQDKIEELRLVSSNKADQAFIQALHQRMKTDYAGKIRAYTRSSRDPDLPVIFVSGKQYKKHLEGSRGRDGPFLDREATGIPALKRLIYGLTTATHFSRLKDIALEHTPRLVKSAITVLSKQPLPEMESVRAAIEKRIQDGAVPIVQHFCDGILSAFITHIEAPFGNKQTIQAWLIKAEHLAENLPGSYHARVFRSFCKQKGRWSVHKQKISWNRLIIDLYSSPLELAFDAFQAECDVLKSGNLSRIVQYFDALRQSIASGPYKGAAGYDEFFEVIKETQDALLVKIGPVLDSRLESLSVIRNDLLLDSKQSYVAQAMEESYKAAEAIYHVKFTGSRRPRVAHSARQAAIGKRILGAKPGITEPGMANIFEAVKKLAGKELRKRRSAISRKLTKVLETDVTDRLMEDFGHRYGVSLSSAQGSRPSTKMVAALRDGLKRLEEAKPLVDRCEEWKRPGNGLF